MKDSYVSNIQDILIANETQKNKIQFLERQRIKRDHYLQDLKENLHLNKSTLKELNSQGPNLEAMNELIRQTDHLSDRIKEYYEEYQGINAVLLMQKQMRLEDKRFYTERMVEFQNKMVDLRKYLHDKEDSFSSVVIRLKRYEDLAQNTMDDKLSNFKKEIGERHINEFIGEILKQKNFYRKEYEKIVKDYVTFEGFKKEIREKYPEIEEDIHTYSIQNKIQLQEVLKNVYRAQEIVQDSEKEGKDKKKSKIEPNKQLIRLLKKQKLTKQLNQDALNDAIEKNQELISIKDIYERNLQKLQSKCQLLYAENTIFALRLAEYDNHYSRFVTHSRRFYQEGQHRGLKEIANNRIKQYAKTIKSYFQSDKDMFKKLSLKIQGQIQQWSEFICESVDIKKQNDKTGLMIKSCSVPNLLVQFQLDDFSQEDKMEIQEY